MNPSQEDRYSSTQDGLKSKPVLRLKKPVQDQDKKRRKQPLTLMILIDGGFVGLALFVIGSKEVKLHSWSLPQEWDGNETSLITALEKSWLSMPELEGLQGLPTVFLISPFWVDGDDSIVVAKKHLLGTVCRRFNLESLGFLLADESLMYQFEKEEDGLPNFISVFVGFSELTISLIHLGKVKSRLRWEKKSSEQLPSQIEEVLGKIDFQGVLPPNLIFWGGKDQWPEELMEKVNRYQWVGKKNSLFLHLPQISFLTWRKFFSYFCLIIAERFVHQPDGFVQKTAQALNPVPEAVGQREKVATGKPEVKNKEAGRPTAELSGIKESGQPPLPEGFSYQDIFLTDLPDKSTESFAVTDAKDRAKKRSFNLAGLGKILPSLRRRFAKFSFKSRSWPLLTVLLLGLVGLVFVFEFYFAKVKVSIFITPQLVKETKQVTIATGRDGFDVDNGLFPGVKIETEQESSGQVEVSGEKMVGEKAVGTVNVFNRTTEKKDFPSGTIIKDSSGLEFSLRDSVSVASKTADLESGVDRLGEAEVGVMAGDIGSDYNLSQGVIFTVKGFSQDDFVVKAKDDFSGGTNRKIKAVSADDLARLKQLLINQASAEGKDSLEKQRPSRLKIISRDLVVKVVDFSPQRREGEEAETLKGSIKMKLSALAIDEESFKNFASLIVNKGAQDNLKLNSDTIKYNLKPTSESTEKIEGEVALEGKLYPTVDKFALTKALAGTKRANANQVLRQYPRVYRFEIDSLLRFWPWFPKNPGKIILKIKEG